MEPTPYPLAQASRPRSYFPVGIGLVVVFILLCLGAAFMYIHFYAGTGFGIGSFGSKANAPANPVVSLGMPAESFFAATSEGLTALPIQADGKILELAPYSDVRSFAIIASTSAITNVYRVTDSMAFPFTRTNTVKKDLAVSTDGSYIAYVEGEGSMAQIRVMQTSDRSIRSFAGGHSLSFFTRSGTHYLLFVTDTSIKILDVESGEVKDTPQTLATSRYAALVNDQGTYLALQKPSGVGFTFYEITSAYPTLTLKEIGAQNRAVNSGAFFRNDFYETVAKDDGMQYLRQLSAPGFDDERAAEVALPKSAAMYYVQP